MEAKNFIVKISYLGEEQGRIRTIARHLSRKKAIRVANSFITQSGLTTLLKCPIGHIFSDGTFCSALMLYRNDNAVATILVDEDTSSSSFEKELEFIKNLKHYESI